MTKNTSAKLVKPVGKYECKIGKACGKIRAQNRESLWENLSAKIMESICFSNFWKTIWWKFFGFCMLEIFSDSICWKFLQALCGGVMRGFWIPDYGNITWFQGMVPRA